MQNIEAITVNMVTIIRQEVNMVFMVVTIQTNQKRKFQKQAEGDIHQKNHITE